MLELQVRQEVGLLDWNFAELNKQVDTEMAKYQNLVITEEQVPDAKKLRAELNKLGTAINDRKIQVKKEFCRPYEQFESEVKVLITKIKTVSAGIDNQIKAFEEMQKFEKKEMIRNFYDSMNFLLVPFERFWDEKWLNKSCDEKTWKAQLSSKVEKVKVDLAIIEKMEVEDKQEVKAIYLETLDITAAEQEYSRRTERRNALKKAQEERKALEKQMLEAMQKQQETARVEEKEATVEIKEETVLYTRAFKVINCTREQIIALGDYMNDHEIIFEKINL